MNLAYVKIGIAIALLLGAFATGWNVRNRDYQDFKKEVNHAAKAQEAHVESVKKQQDIVTKGIQNDYESKLAALRNYYGGMQLNSSSRSMPGISAAPKGADAETAYPILVGQCAETTAQLTSFQDWINAQVGIK
jgi:hypothetical protein